MDFKLKKSNLNFRVYTSPTVPETGEENDIVIISYVPMKNWMMSPDEPSGIPRNDGDVWIQYTVTGETYNVLKNATMLIATIFAWQYVDGEWVDVPSGSYHNGMWNNIIEYLYDQGDECTDITGGWSTGGPTSTSGYSIGTMDTSNNKITIIADKMKFISAKTTNKVDLTDCASLEIIVDSTTLPDKAYAYLCIYKDSSYWFSDNTIARLPLTGNGTFSIPVADIDGSYYVGFSIESDITRASVTVSAVKLTKVVKRVIYLYNEGDQRTSLTGGWAVSSNGVNSTYPNTGKAPTVTYNADSVRIEQTRTTSVSYAGLWYTKNKVSLAGKTKLTALLENISNDTTNAEAYLQIRTGVSGYMHLDPDTVAYETIVKADSIKNTEPTIDLSSLNLDSSTKYYVCIGVYSTFKADVKEIRIE